MSSNTQESPLQQRIRRQRATLYNMLIDPMHRAANRVAEVWRDREALDAELLSSMQKVPYATFLYGLDLQGR